MHRSPKAIHPDETGARVTIPSMCSSKRLQSRLKSLCRYMIVFSKVSCVHHHLILPFTLYCIDLHLFFTRITAQSETQTLDLTGLVR